MTKILLLLCLVAITGCSSAKFEAGEVTAPGVHLKDVKVEGEGKPAAPPADAE